MKALAAFQAECPPINKDVKNEYSNYNYADLPSILAVINPLLSKHGLMITQPIEADQDRRYIKTILYHLESKESIESRIDIPIVSMKGMNDYQALGSGITYLRRYSLSSILGIVTDEDTDASGEQSKTAPNTSNKPPNNTSDKKQPDIWLNREVPRNSGKITEDWYKAVAYLRGDLPRKDGQEPKLVDLELKYKISKQNKEDLMNDVMDTNFIIPE